MTTQTQHGLATLRKPQLEVTIPTQPPFLNPRSQTIEEKLDFGVNLPNYPTHTRIVEVQEVESQIKMILIGNQNSAGKEAIRKIYEQGFNWESWLKFTQEKAQKQGQNLAGYHLIDYVTHDERYLGQSWSDVCEHLAEAGYDSH